MTNVKYLKINDQFDKFFDFVTRIKSILGICIIDENEGIYILIVYNNYNNKERYDEKEKERKMNEFA